MSDLEKALRPALRVIAGGIVTAAATAAPVAVGERRTPAWDGPSDDEVVRELLRKRAELTLDADRLAKRAHAVVDRIVAINRVIEAYGGDPQAA